jgi:hypothetical protein
MTRRTWTDDTVLAELTAVIGELGRFPKKTDLEARGIGGLWGAMQRRGGIAVWRERVTATAEPAFVATAGAADVAVAAYFLYQNGHPGGPEEHWLAAERELAAV